MNAEQLRALQAPLKDEYRSHPEAARVQLRSSGSIQYGSLFCLVQTGQAAVKAGLHPAAGGDGNGACSGDMLLDALVACAGVTMAAVATAMNVPFRQVTITAEGEMDFRGTLGVAKDAPIGITNIQLTYDVHSDAPQAQIDKLVQLTERYCVIYQTLQHPPQITHVVQINGTPTSRNNG